MHFQIVFSLSHKKCVLWQLFGDSQTRLNQLKVHFSIMLCFGFLLTRFFAIYGLEDLCNNIQTFKCARETRTMHTECISSFIRVVQQNMC